LSVETLRERVALKSSKKAKKRILRKEKVFVHSSIGEKKSSHKKGGASLTRGSLRGRGF